MSDRQAKQRAWYKQRMLLDPAFAERERKRKREWERRKKLLDPDYRLRQCLSSKKWAYENPEKAKVSQRNKYLNRVIVRRYGITREQYDAMLAAQNGVCAICKTDGWGRSGSPCIDHNHSTGKVRGLLCHKCNVGIGAFSESIDTIKSAIDYLNK